MAIGAADDAARAGMKLVRWLANQGDDVVASAEDLARFGPNAARVRGLLDFLPTLSDEAIDTTRRSWLLANRAPVDTPLLMQNLRSAGLSSVNRIRQASAAADDAYTTARSLGLRNVAAPIELSAEAESLVTPESIDLYRAITNPLAAGRAVDLLRARPRYQGTPFLDVVRQAAERGAVRGPRDVIAAGRIARSPEDIREIALTLMADGMPAEEAMRTAMIL